MAYHIKHTSVLTQRTARIPDSSRTGKVYGYCRVLHSRLCIGGRNARPSSGPKDRRTPEERMNREVISAFIAPIKYVWHKSSAVR